MNKKFNLLFLLATFGFVKAQLPETDLWLFKIDHNKEGIVFVKPKNITNRGGYDNQPSFSSDGKKIYYSSVREDNQADIYYHDVKKGTNIQLTKTPISEYSPVETPDGNHLSSVVVEADSVQCIHFINKVSGVHERKYDFDSVGYYNFLNADTCVYYKLTEPHSLRYYNGKEDRWLGIHPVRGFKTVNRHSLIYGLKDSVKVSFYQYDFLLHKAEKYCDYPSLNEDVIWHPSFGLVKSEGTKLIRFDVQKKEWILMTDLAWSGIKKITRFCFDPEDKYLVVVDNN